MRPLQFSERLYFEFHALSIEMKRSVQRGITLIELMVVMAIIAILAAIAYPSYQTQVRQSRRSAAEAFLMEAAGRQHQRMVDVRSYAELDDLKIATPSDLNGFYSFNATVVDGPPSTFELTATPTGAQVKDKCGTLKLDQAGSKTAVYDGTTVTGCW